MVERLGFLTILANALNLLSLWAFLLMTMSEVDEIGPLPINEARAGAAEAWNVLFRRYQMPVYVYVFELLRHEQASLDVVQETFMAAVRHIGSLRDDAKFGSWLFGIAHQKCLQRWRKKTEVLLDEIPEDTGEIEMGPDDLLIRREQEAEFMKLLDELPVPHRSVLLLHYIEDFSIEEISRITESQLGTVKSRLHYAKKSLRKLWEEKNENPA